MSVSRFVAPAVLAATLGFAAIAAPAPAQAQSSDELVRVLVNVADVVMRGNTPYYRYGDYGYNDRLIAQRDRYGRVVYYRDVPRGNYRTQYRPGAPYGNAYGYYRKQPVAPPQRVNCNKHGKCKATYYDPRHDRDGRYGYNARMDRREDRRWRERDDD
ncbi:hypothetical protein [Thermomonas sp.]